VFRQQDRGNHYLYTQFESHYARRAVPCFDEPRWKTPWKLTMRLPAGQLAFANTPARRDEVLGARRVVEFAETKPIPSYLLAFAAGPFEVVDAGSAGKNNTPLRIIVPRGLTDQTAFAAAHMGNLLELLEDYFGRPYPYEKLDSIAMPTFIGAMENPGLITYDRRYLLAQPGAEPDWFHRSFIGIASHEMGHQWFGNLVTLAWWDDFWLNESFTAWITAKVVEQYRPKWNRAIDRVERADDAMSDDSSAASRPIYIDVPGLPNIWTSLSIVYSKGESVIGMFERWLGKERFQQGVRAYLDEHAWKSVTRDDFFASLAAVSDPALADAFATFILQPGAPVVKATLQCDKGQPPRVALAQRHFVFAGQTPDRERRWHIPVCVRYGRGKRSARSCALMTDREMTLPLEGSRQCPSWLVANEGGIGYYRSEYSPRDFESLLLGRRGASLSEAERLSVLNDLNATFSAGTADARLTFSLIARLANDKSPNIAYRAAQLVGAAEFLVDDKTRPAYQRFIRKLFGNRARRLGWKTRKGDDQQTTRLRSRLLRLVVEEGGDQAMGREAVKIVNQWLDAPDSADTNTLAAALQSVGRTGDRRLYERLLETAKAETDARRKRRLLQTLSLFADPDLVRRNLDLFVAGTFEPRLSPALLWGPLYNPAVAPIVWEFTRENLDAVRNALPGISRQDVASTAIRVCDRAGLAEAIRILGPLYPPGSDGERDYDLVVDRIRQCIAQREAHQANFAAFLSAN